MSPPGGSILSLVAALQAIIFFFWEQRFEQAIPKAEKVQLGLGLKFSKKIRC